MISKGFAAGGVVGRPAPSGGPTSHFPKTVVETAPATNSTIRPSVAPSRQGRVHIGAYLPADFKRGIRMLQATTGEDLQSILARVLNEQFRLHNLPVVGQD